MDPLRQNVKLNYATATTSQLENATGTWTTIRVDNHKAQELTASGATSEDTRPGSATVSVVSAKTKDTAGKPVAATHN
jgi:hypothetical protein